MNRIKPSFWLFLKNKMYFINSPVNHPLGFLGSLMLFIVPLTYFWIASRFSFILLAIFSSLAILILINGISLILHWGKFQKFAPIFRNGSETVGDVVEVYFSRGSGYITYEYEYQ